MESVCENLEEKIDDVSAKDIQGKRQLFDYMRSRFSDMEKLLAKLPKEEQERVWIVLSKELIEVTGKFSFEIANRILADERTEAERELHRDGDAEPMLTMLRKHLDLYMGRV